jgi:hypothetical protein
MHKSPPLASPIFGNLSPKRSRPRHTRPLPNVTKCRQILTVSSNSQRICEPHPHPQTTGSRRFVQDPVHGHATPDNQPKPPIQPNQPQNHHANPHPHHHPQLHHRHPSRLHPTRNPTGRRLISRQACALHQSPPVSPHGAGGRLGEIRHFFGHTCRPVRSAPFDSTRGKPLSSVAKFSNPAGKFAGKSACFPGEELLGIHPSMTRSPMVFRRSNRNRPRAAACHMA